MARIQLPPITSFGRSDRPYYVPPWAPGGSPDSYLAIRIGPDSRDRDLLPVWPDIPVDLPGAQLPGYEPALEFSREWTRLPGTTQDGPDAAAFTMPDCFVGLFLSIYGNNYLTEADGFVPDVWSWTYPGGDLDRVRRGGFRGGPIGPGLDPVTNAAGALLYMYGPYYYVLSAQLYDPHQEIDPTALPSPYTGLGPFSNGIILPTRVGIH